jgi:hypothetical protein
MKVNEYLASLGASADEVAESLRKQGVKGKRRSACKCPILNGIYKAIPNYWSGLEIYGSATFSLARTPHYHATLRDSQIIDPTLPQAVMDFIANFDSGQYPELDSEISVGPED